MCWMACCTTKVTWKSGGHYTDIAGFTDHVFALMYLPGGCVLSVNQGSPRHEAVYQRESRPIPGASVTDINDQPESERNRNSLACSAASGNLDKAGKRDGLPDAEKACQLPQAKRTCQSTERNWPH